VDRRERRLSSTICWASILSCSAKSLMADRDDVGEGAARQERLQQRRPVGVIGGPVRSARDRFADEIGLLAHLERAVSLVLTVEVVSSSTSPVLPLNGCDLDHHFADPDADGCEVGVDAVELRLRRADSAAQSD
jgi:hypothetical protein